MQENHLKKILILIPVFNDWDCVILLHENIKKCFEQNENDYRLLIVDDGSEQSIPKSILSEKLDLLRLNRNLGHQRAIAIGLCYILEKPNIKDFEAVVIMDSDGEDNPDDINLLIGKYREQKEVIVAVRKKRSESFAFKSFYWMYKLVFKLLTKEKIDFGNFSLLPVEAIEKIVLYSELWNHYPGTIVRSKLSYSSIATNRGVRYKGKSKMNLTSLIIHGISSISIFLDVVATRLIFASFFAMGFGLIGILVVVIIRSSVDWYIPGWATYTTLGLLSFIFLLFLISLFMVLLVLFFRSSTMFIPIEKYKSFIKDIRLQ